MKILVKQGDLVKEPADLLVINLFEGLKKTGGPAGLVNQALGGQIDQIIKSEQFETKECRWRLIDTLDRIPAKRVLLIGLGQSNQFSAETVRKVSAVSLNQARQIKAQRISSIVHGADRLNPAIASQAMVEGARLGLYRYDRFKSNKKPNPKSLTLIEPPNGAKIKALTEGITRGELFARATIMARDLINTPPFEMTPRHLAETARTIAKQNTNIKLKIFDEVGLAKLGAGAILGISRGSHEQARLIHLVYQPVKQSRTREPKFNRRCLVLIGKGVTFDSGGLSLKDWKDLLTMKMDMAGAAAVLAIFSVLNELKPNIELHGVIPATENLLGANPIKPGDVVKSLSGKTIEVLHTDAEGRVILADALEYGRRQIQKSKYKGRPAPGAIIDLATLTGAVMIALGDQRAGLFHNNQDLADLVKQAAKTAGEKVWELPLLEEYADQLKSDVADLSNMHQTRWGGASLGAMFLAEFVGTIPWVHLDIGGAAFAQQKWNPYTPKGAVGAGVRTLLELLAPKN